MIFIIFTPFIAILSSGAAYQRRCDLTGYNINLFGFGCG
ncbi:hypothetical protein MED193_21521 [Roseobacter sp. MED193]|nr:hypothetical protein MED193_21521 [Roseobacter sp. MED193]